MSDLAATANSQAPTASRKAGGIVLAGLGLLLLITGPWFFYPGFLMKAMCFALFASAYNLIFGFGGLLSFGHAAFFGGGAYVAGHAAKVWGFPPELMLLTGAVVGMLLGALFGVFAIRRQGIYLAMVTLAFAQMVYFLALRAPFTGGEDGLQGIPRGHLFGLIDLNDMDTMYYFLATVFVLVVMLIVRIVNSPFGQALKAVRDNELRAASLGYDVNMVKLQAFVLSAMLSGLAGAMKALVFQLVALSDVHWMMSGEVVLMTLLGGAGTLIGPIIGATAIVTMQNYLAGFGSWVMMIQGAIFVLCVLLLRGGIARGLASLWALVRNR
uniref:branched-chain amino acid ABC transporter permease n=1 Tax=Stappia sp. TaxID=1870903 RepID=UPI003BA9F683